MDAEAKLRRARTMLVIGIGDEPFFGSIALGLELTEDLKCPSAATDCKKLWYNPLWIDSIDVEETMGVFEHEVLHVVFKHPMLMREMIKEPDFDNDIWQRACDQPINELLLKKGRKLPGTPMYDPQYDGMSVVRVYRIMLEDKMAQMATQQPDCDGQDQTENTDGDNQDTDNNQDESTGQNEGVPEKYRSDPNMGGGVVPPTDEEGDIKLIEEDSKLKVINAARVLEKDHSDIPGFVKAIIEAHTEPQRSYKDELMDIMEEITRDDYSWGKPNIKYGDIYIPSLWHKKIAELVVAVDASGSVSDREIEIYGGEISGILEEFDGIEVTVIYHSMTVTHVETFRNEDLPISLNAVGRGGTCYKDTFKEIERRDLDPLVLLYFTDLWVGAYNYPSKKPEYPVYWLNTTPRKADGSLRHSTPPWGTVIDLDPEV